MLAPNRASRVLAVHKPLEQNPGLCQTVPGSKTWVVFQEKILVIHFHSKLYIHIRSIFIYIYTHTLHFHRGHRGFYIEYMFFGFQHDNDHAENPSGSMFNRWTAVISQRTFLEVCLNSK